MFELTKFPHVLGIRSTNVWVKEISVDDFTGLRIFVVPCFNHLQEHRSKGRRPCTRKWACRRWGRSSPPSSSISSRMSSQLESVSIVIYFFRGGGSTTLFTGMAGSSMHMQWPLTSQSHGCVSQREQLFFCYGSNSMPDCNLLESLPFKTLAEFHRSTRMYILVCSHAETIQRLILK
jgi:hypothetical protein